MTYWDSEAARAKEGAKPLKDNVISVADYKVERVAGALGAFQLKPVKDGLTRIWDFRVPAPSTEADVEAWLSAFAAQAAASSTITTTA